MSNSSPMPVPIAVIIAWISLFESTLLMRFFSTLMIFPRSGRIAWKLRSRASTAEPPALSPSTRKSSAELGSVIEQSASLPGRPPPPSADLRRISSRALRAAWRARLAAITLFTIGAGLGGVLLEELRKLGVARGLDEAADRGVAELGLRLALELRLAQLHRDDRGQALAAVVAVRASSFSFRSPLLRA